MREPYMSSKKATLRRGYMSSKKAHKMLALNTDHASADCGKSSLSSFLSSPFLMRLLP